MFELMLSRNWRSLLGALLAVSAQAMGEPTPVADEALLLFLADMVEVDGELTDALDLLEVDVVGQNLNQSRQSKETVFAEENAKQ
jgi:hypothetical protein